MRFLVVRLSAFGDAVHAFPVASALKRAFPEAEVGWLAERKTVPILQLCSAIDRVFAVDTYTWRKHPWLLLSRNNSERPTLHHFLDEIREFAPEIALDVQGNVKSGVFSRLAGAPERIGFAAAALREKENAWFTTRRIPGSFRDCHVVEKNLALLRPLGVEVSPEEVSFDIQIPLDTLHEVRQFLSENLPSDEVADPPLLMLHPSAAWASKRMPWETWVAVARRVREEGLYRLLLAWAPGEEAMVEHFRKELGEGLLVPPKTGFDFLAGLMHHCDAFLGPDTGPMHLAAAMGVPCAAFFGPTLPERNGPWGKGHAVLFEPGSEGPRHQRVWKDPDAYWRLLSPERIHESLVRISRSASDRRRAARENISL